MKIRLAGALLVCALPGALLAQIAVLQIKVLEGEGTVFGAGTRSTRPLVVQVTDETGGPVPGAAVTFHMPGDGPGGVFGNGLRTEMAITDADGRAAVRNLQLNRTPGRFEIRILAVREQARAGTISSHYISDRTRGGGNVNARESAPAGGRAPSVRLPDRSRRKWLALALVAAGAAGGGVAASVLGGGRQPSAAASTSPGVMIGMPAITVGKP